MILLIIRFWKEFFHYSVWGKSLGFAFQLCSNRKQNIAYDNNKRSKCLTIARRVPQGSILGPLLILIYANDLLSASTLDLTIFTGNTNLFYTHKNLKFLLNAAYKELDHIRSRFNANKSLNTDKTKPTLLHKLSRKDYIALRLVVLRIDKVVIERTSRMKSLRVLLDEHLAWNHHFHLPKSKIWKNMVVK